MTSNRAFLSFLNSNQVGFFQFESVVHQSNLRSSENDWRVTAKTVKRDVNHRVDEPRKASLQDAGCIMKYWRQKRFIMNHEQIFVILLIPLQRCENDQPKHLRNYNIAQHKPLYLSKQQDTTLVKHPSTQDGNKKTFNRSL